MRKRPPYTECKLYTDGIPSLEVGQFLRTEAGSAYLVQAMRPSRSRPNRRHLRCLRWPLAEIPTTSTVHTIHWYSRDKKGKH